jgi:hypothetical protein
MRKLLFLVLLLAPASARTQANKDQIALLRWYGGNQAGVNVEVGVSPHSLAFDGENIWATIPGAQRVTKFRANDGAILGTYTLSGSPDCIAFDGANVWIAIGNKASVVKLKASDGSVVGSFPVGSQPIGGLPSTARTSGWRIRTAAA